MCRTDRHLSFITNLSSALRLSNVTEVDGLPSLGRHQRFPDKRWRELPVSWLWNRIDPCTFMLSPCSFSLISLGFFFWSTINEWLHVAEQQTMTFLVPHTPIWMAALIPTGMLLSLNLVTCYGEDEIVDSHPNRCTVQNGSNFRFPVVHIVR